MSVEKQNLATARAATGSATELLEPTPGSSSKTSILVTQTSLVATPHARARLDLRQNLAPDARPRSFSLKFDQRCSFAQRLTGV